MKKIFKDYFTVTFGTALGRGLSFVTSLILARSLGAHGFGIFSLFFTVMILIWQMPNIIDAIYVRYVKTETGEKRIEYVRTTFFMKAIISILLLVLAYPVSYLLSFYVFHKPQMQLHLIAAIIAGVSLSLFSTLPSICQAQEHFHTFSVLNMLFYGVVFLGIIITVFFNWIFTPLIVTLIYSLSALAMGCYGIIYLYNRTKPFFPISTFLLQDMIHFGKWLLAESFIYIILQRLDVLFLATLANYEELGIYSAAVRIAMFATILTSSATAIFMPRGCMSLKSTNHLKSYFKDSFTVISTLIIFILILIIISPVLIKIFFGAQYINCLTSARILLLDTIFVLLYTPFSFLFYATGNTRQIFIFGAAKLAIAIMSLLLLVPRYGSTGAATSIVFSSFWGWVLVMIVSSKIIKSPHNYLQMLGNLDYLNKNK